MPVRCKLRCMHVEPPNPNSHEDYRGARIRMSAVFAGSTELQQASENAIFGKWTPQAELTMFIVNPDAFKQFVAGQEYYVDIHPAPAIREGT